MLNALVATLGELVVKTRRSRGLSQAAFAALIGVDTRTVGNLEVGRTKSVKLKNVPPLARELGVSPDELISMFPEAVDNEDDAADTIPAGIADLSFNQPPRYDLDVRANAWAQVPICELDMDDPRQRAIAESGRFQLRILGSCMEPEFENGDIIELEIIRWDNHRMETGECYVVCRCDNTATFKQLVRRTEEAIYLAALNQQDFPGEIEVPMQEIGRVAKLVGHQKPPRKLEVVKVRKG